MITKNERINGEDTWKYLYVTYENNDPALPMAKVTRDDNGNIDEQWTFSQRFLNTLHEEQDIKKTKKNKKKRKVSASEIGEGAVEVADSVIEEILDSLPWPINWIAILLWWIIKGLWWIISLPFKLIWDLFKS